MKELTAPRTAAKRRRRDIVYMPTRQHHTGKAVLAGALCRALLSALLVFGLTLLVADAFRIYPDSVGASPMFWCAIFCALSISMICRGGRYTAAGIVIILGGMTAFAATVSVDIQGLAVEAVTAIHNTVVDRFVYVGLTTVHSLKLATSASEMYTEAEVYKCGVMMLTLLISIIFVPAICRRCRMIYLVLATSVFLFPACAYNMMKSNWGFAVFVSAASGVIVLWAHDKGYTVPTRKKRLVNMDGVISMSDADRHQKKVRVRQKRDKDKVDEIGLMFESRAETRRRRKAEKARERDAEKAERAEAKRRASELREAERPSREAVNDSAALGGAAGLVTALLSLMIVALPASFVETSHPGLPYISELMAKARTYFTAMIESDMIDLNRTPSEGFAVDDGGIRTTEAIPLKYENALVATVFAPYNTPVYLRSWIGTTYENDRWYSASLGDADAFRDAFGEEFTPETIRENFCRAMFPGFDAIEINHPIVNMSKYGFVTERISVRRESGKSTLLYMPSFVIPSRGLLSYGSASPSFLPHSIYYDGIWTSRLFTEGTSYATESAVTVMFYQGLNKTFGDSIMEYMLTLEAISSGQADEMIGADPDVAMSFIKMYERRFVSEYDIALVEEPLIRRYILSMTDEERAALRQAAETEKRYREYVLNTYLQTDRRDIADIRSVAQSILHLNGFKTSYGAITVSNYHDAIMALVEYLDACFVYTKEPPKSTSKTDDAYKTDGGRRDNAYRAAENGPGSSEEQLGTSAVVEFLTETRKGYCVQFASALTLMLRSVGIPARYCEGFIASDFMQNTGEDISPEMKYTADVLDSNAHAWVEVYYEGMGWVQYEATPSYGDKMYGTSEGASTPVPPTVIKPVEPDNPETQPPPETTAETTPTDDEEPIDKTPGARTRSAAIIAAVAAITVVIAAIAVYAAHIKNSSDRAIRERMKLIETCRDTERELPEGEVRRAAHEINLGIFDVYRNLGLPPETGEQSAEYAERLEGVVGAASDKPISKVLGFIGEEEFGHSLPREGLAELAEYYGELTSRVYEGLSLRDRFVLRYIRHVL